MDDKQGFWEYCQANLREVLSWPAWMRGGSVEDRADVPEREGAKIGAILEGRKLPEGWQADIGAPHLRED